MASNNKSSSNNNNLRTPASNKASALLLFVCLAFASIGFTHVHALHSPLRHPLDRKHPMALSDFYIKRLEDVVCEWGETTENDAITCPVQPPKALEEQQQEDEDEDEDEDSYSHEDVCDAATNDCAALNQEEDDEEYYYNEDDQDQVQDENFEEDEDEEYRSDLYVHHWTQAQIKEMHSVYQRYLRALTETYGDDWEDEYELSESMETIYERFLEFRHDHHYD